MFIQDALTITLGLMAALAILLWWYGRNRRGVAGDALVHLRNRLAELVHFNSSEGTIQSVAGKVSRILSQEVDCSRFVFLRKKRGVLELNYCHGCTELKRREFRIPFRKELADKLIQSYLPRSVDDIRDLIPSHLVESMIALGLTRFFPVFWRTNLYGVYFIPEKPAIESRTFDLIAVALASSLSAAYHVKWHESKLEALQSKSEDTIVETVPGEENLLHGLIHLVRDRDSESLILKIIEVVRSGLGLDRVAFLYQQRDLAAPPLSATSGSVRGFGSVDQITLDALTNHLSPTGPTIGGFPVVLSELTDSGGQLRSVQESLAKSGYKYVVLFPLTLARQGVLAWSGGPQSSIVGPVLQVVNDYVQDLVDNAESFERIETLSYRDNLTGLANQRYFFRRLDEEINRADRFDRSLALIFFDLDQMKAVNDTHGHQAGDEILRQMGMILSRSIRAIDIVARYGGDEFCITMPETDIDHCLRFMERLRTTVAAWEFHVNGIGTPLSCTVSLGGAVFPNHAEDSKGLVFAADMALLKAKVAGRNSFLMYRSEADTIG